MKQSLTSKINAAIIWCMYQAITIETPFDTGNLRWNGLNLDRTASGWRIWVDADDPKAVAFYMKYTNEDWNNFAPPLFGKVNPNQGWWNRQAVEFVHRLAEELHGEVTEV